MDITLDRSNDVWLLEPVVNTTPPPAVSSILSTAANRSGLLANIQNAAGELIDSAIGDLGAFSNVTQSFDIWFFSGSETNVYLLAIFLIIVVTSLGLSLVVGYLILFRSRSTTNLTYFHYVCANFLFLLGNIIRFGRAQTGSYEGCQNTGPSEISFYLDVIATPVAHVVLALMSVERFAFHAGHTCSLFKRVRSPAVITGVMITIWVLAGFLALGLFVLLRMLSVSDMLKSVAAKMTSSKKLCNMPLNAMVLSPVKDILTAAFVCTVIIPSMSSVFMQTILQCIACRANNKQSIMQKSSVFVLVIILMHLVLTLPHVILTVFMGHQYKSIAWMLFLRAVNCAASLIVFLMLEPTCYGLVFAYILKRKPPPLSSTMNVGDIDTLIASVDVSPKSMFQPTGIDQTDFSHLISNGRTQGGGMSARHHAADNQRSYRPDSVQHSSGVAAQHPYLAIRPARLYFERPQSVTAAEVGRSARSLYHAPMNDAMNRSHNLSPVAFPPTTPRSRASPKPPPLPPRRRSAMSVSHHQQPARRNVNAASRPSPGSGGFAHWRTPATGNGSRSLPSSTQQKRRRVISHHHQPSRNNNNNNVTMPRGVPVHRHSRMPVDPVQQRLYQSDYRLSLCDERMAVQPENRSSPGGWFETVVTNEAEV